MKRVLQFLVVVALIGLGIFLGQITNHQEQIDQCFPCYPECKKTFQDLGADVAGEFQWEQCRDFCLGHGRCREDFAFWYVGVRNDFLAFFQRDKKTPPAIAVNAGQGTAQVMPDSGIKMNTSLRAPKRAEKGNRSVSPKSKKAGIKRNWEDAKAYCLDRGMRLPDKNEMSQHLLSRPSKARTGEKFWAIGPLYPDGFPPLVSMSTDSFAVTPGDPVNAHAVFCFPK